MSNKVYKAVATSTNSSVLATLASQEPDQQRNTLTSYVEDTVLELLRPIRSVPREELSRGFVAVGLDSMLAIELIYRLEKDFGVSINPEALEVDSVHELVEYLFEHVVRPLRLVESAREAFGS